MGWWLWGWVLGVVLLAVVMVVGMVLVVARVGVDARWQWWFLDCCDVGAGCWAFL